MLLRVLLTAAVVIAFATESDAQRFRRRARLYGAPGVGVAVTPGGGVSVRTPYYSFDRPAGMPSPSAFYGGYRGFGWPGVSVRVGGPTSAATNSPTPAPGGEYDPAPGDEYNPTPATASYNLAPRFEPTSATRAGLEGELAVAHAGLNARLDMFNGGAGWQKYFALDQQELADPAKADKLLRRMDSVAADQQFEAVSSLPEFQRMHAALQAINSADLGQAPPTDEPAGLPAEDTGEMAPEMIPAPQNTPPAKPQPPTAATTPGPTAPTPAEPQYEDGERSILRAE